MLRSSREQETECDMWASVCLSLESAGAADAPCRLRYANRMGKGRRSLLAVEEGSEWRLVSGVEMRFSYGCFQWSFLVWKVWTFGRDGFARVGVVG